MGTVTIFRLMVCCALLACAGPSLPPPAAPKPPPALDDYAGRADAAARARDEAALHEVIVAWFAAEPEDLRARTLRLVEEEEGEFNHELVYRLASSPLRASTQRSRVAFVVIAADSGFKSTAKELARAQVLLEQGHSADAMLEAEYATHHAGTSDKARELSRAIIARATRELELAGQDGAAPVPQLETDAVDIADVERAWYFALAGDTMGAATSISDGLQRGGVTPALADFTNFFFERNQPASIIDASLAHELWETRATTQRPWITPSWASLTPKTPHGADLFCVRLMRRHVPEAAARHCVRAWQEGTSGVLDEMAELVMTRPELLAPWSLTPASVFKNQVGCNNAYKYRTYEVAWRTKEGDSEALVETLRATLVMDDDGKPMPLSAAARLALAKRDGILLRAMADRPATRRARLLSDGILALASRDVSVARAIQESLARGEAHGASDAPGAAATLAELIAATEKPGAKEDVALTTSLLERQEKMVR